MRDPRRTVSQNSGRNKANSKRIAIWPYVIKDDFESNSEC